MAQAAPASGGTARQTRTPDVFGERTHTAAKWAAPVLMGLVYGYWAAANRRHGGEITGWNLLFGFVTAFAFMVLYVAVRALAPRMKRERHALTWFAFTGCAAGFLHNQSGQTVLWSAAVGLIVGASFFAVLFYRYYTHEDAAGRRVG
ncbi:hypothetical protein [Streptomyces sp. TRM68367]|uniref:hypothetical protein n=1 Tax=Streptomyces sp. TRM68367 TaxID=2758415 RepID=UPI00165A5C21|nr:hypothetical protein [Streptomyces sp. TRM68367]MBC9728927.1 hypothetical protein [Streptomyces sp. TRM68367]